MPFAPRRVVAVAGLSLMAAHLAGQAPPPGSRSQTATRRSAPAPQSPGAKDDKKWDVSAPLGPTVRLSFDTSEGTWINVDLSPDGRRIVFDILGDLYIMPIDGSGAQPATRLTSGPAFDMQPRFSPDGSAVAFASDRGGLMNIWVMKTDGTAPKQVSRDQKWWINSPTWSPDGEYIFARRHFVQTRSLGAGEIWMFHRSGADGLQVTEKSNWQKDAGEPAISPDGRFLYYSKDVTPGQTFEYNRNPYGTIYAILRRDLQTGRERRYVSRPGGSITPRPSPDGKSLAFIRRVGTASHLFVKDLQTGAESAIFDRLDKDLQEAWAIFGVYTQYAWTPDSRAIVIWGEGKIWRVDVGARQGTPIPFTVHVDQTLTEALRFPVKVHADQFPVRMLRDVTVAPDGGKVAYSALGHLYVKPLPSGEPRRVTTSQELEFDPAFSPDGSRLVYVTWSDEGRGRVRVAPLDGSAPRDLVREPGHYVEPSFSPMGNEVVYRRVPGDAVRGATHGENPGIYVVAATKDEAPRLVREEGTEPRFDHTGTRIYFQDTREGKAVLASVTLGNAEELVHVRSENAIEFAPSPDGRWIAFAERYKAFVAPFPRTGRTIDLGPKSTAHPVAQVSRDAGLYLQWSGDSRRIHWALGPELFTRDLARTFSFVEQGLDKPAEPERAGVPIGFTASSDRVDGRMALVGARLITMGGDGVVENGVILVEGGRISAVGSAQQVSVPEGAKRIDVSGKTILPGLVDVHAHVGSERNGLLAELSWPLAANLAYGVTTLHDPSNDTETVFSNAEMIRAGMKLGPRLFSTGTVLYGAETPSRAVIESYEDALSHVRRMKAVGAFSVKSYNQQRRDSRQMIVKAARELGMMVVPEGGSLLYLDETLVHDGHTGVEHSLPVPRIYKDIVTLFGKSRVGYTPTLIVGFGGLSGEYYWYQHDEVWKNQRLLAFTPREVVDARARRREMAAEDDFHHVLIARGAKQILDAGGLVQLGAHGQLQGLGAHWELWMLAQGGMTPLEAMRSATLTGATYLGLDAELGSLERGKLADLVVLEKNPLENIRNSDSVAMVMVNGRLYDAATLDEIAPRVRKRPPFWWEPARHAAPTGN
jgi:Tol biopolymer transport system component/imidazolonepropionase-like amidohydrolase